MGLKRIEKLVGKLRHAVIGIPGVKALFGPINRLMATQPKMVFWDRCPEAKEMLQDWRTLIRTAAKEPTHTRELVPGKPDYVGALDASGEGAGGVWLPAKSEMAPIVWRFEWPPEVIARLVTEDNPDGDLTNSDLEMCAELLGWLVLETCTTTLRWKHVGVWSDNSPTIAWTSRWASKRSAAANRLLRVLAICHRENRGSPLVARHLAGIRNRLGDILSRSFGYKDEWHFTSDDAFLSFFNTTFPLPNKNSWTGFRLTSAIATKAMRELLTGGSPMAEWNRLPKIGRTYGKNGRSTAAIWECLRTWTAAPSETSPASQPCLADDSDKESEGTRSRQPMFEQGSVTSTRRSPWTRETSRSTSVTGFTS